MTTGRNNVSGTRMVATLAAVMASVAILAACSSGDGSIGTSSASAIAQTGAHNAADIDFAQQMVPHHRQAIEMSDIILQKKSADPRVVSLATRIKSEQETEISTMQNWLRQWGIGSSTPSTATTGKREMNMPNMPDMSNAHGLMSRHDMDALRNAHGLDASKRYLTGMIAHHRGALAMAKPETTGGSFPAEVELAKSILTGQQREIDEMQNLLEEL